MTTEQLETLVCLLETLMGTQAWEIQKEAIKEAFDGQIDDLNDALLDLASETGTDPVIEAHELR